MEKEAARRKRKYLSKPIDPRKKAERLAERFEANAALHRQLKTEAMERWRPETVCIKPRCLEPRHTKDYCARHHKQELRRERIQPR